MLWLSGFYLLLTPYTPSLGFFLGIARICPSCENPRTVAKDFVVKSLDMSDTIANKHFTPAQSRTARRLRLPVAVDAASRKLLVLRLWAYGCLTASLQQTDTVAQHAKLSTPHSAMSLRNTKIEAAHAVQNMFY